jgi:hypothetical protein
MTYVHAYVHPDPQDCRDYAQCHGRAHGSLRRRSRVAGCSTCDRDPEGRQIMPPHDASDRCESGRHNHCSCDTCF